MRTADQHLDRALVQIAARILLFLALIVAIFVIFAIGAVLTISLTAWIIEAIAPQGMEMVCFYLAMGVATCLTIGVIGVYAADIDPIENIQKNFRSFKTR